MATTNLFDAQTTTGRIVPQVPEPVTNRLSIADVYDSKGKPRHEVLREHMRREGRLELDAALSIIHKGYYCIFSREHNVNLTLLL